MTMRPHDAIFRVAFERPEHAAQLLRGRLPSAVSAAIDWSSLVPEPASFVDPALADHHTDLLFSARMIGGRDQVLLYLLLEHQSTNDPDMPLRVLAYEIRIWERFRRNHVTGPLPVILPVVVSHAEGGWTAPRSFHELLEPHPSLIPGLGELVPQLSLVIEDLAHVSNAQLKARSLAAFPKLVLWALRDARDPDRLFENLRHWATTFTDAAKARRGIEALAQLMRYFLLVTDLEVEVFRAAIREISPASEEAVITTGEKLIAQGHAQGVAQGHAQGVAQGHAQGIAQGHAQGIAQGHAQGVAQGHAQGVAQGHAQGRIDMLRKLLVLKFGRLDVEHEARLASVNEALLDRYLERALSETTLAGVFGA